MARLPADPTKKPVPQKWGEWAREVSGIEVYLRETATIARRKGNEWVQGMRKYYRGRLKHLRDHEPKRP